MWNFHFLMILASPMILLRNDIQLTLNDIIFVFIHEVNIIAFRQYHSPQRISFVRKDEYN